MQDISSAKGHLKNVHNILDDVIIWGKSQHEHDFYLQKALQQIPKHGLTLNKEKCLFNLPKITFFRRVLSKDGISANETKIQAIKKPRFSNISRKFYT